MGIFTTMCFKMSPQRCLEINRPQNTPGKDNCFTYYNNAIEQIRASPTYTGSCACPQTPVQERRCMLCNVIEDEAHFSLSCQINQKVRIDLLKNIEIICPECRNITGNNQIYCIFKMRTDLYWHVSEHLCITRSYFTENWIPLDNSC